VVPPSLSQVIQSENTGGLITSASLSALSKFLSLGFIHKASADASQAMSAISRAVNGCKFESVDDATDEVVILKILSVILTCVRCDAGAILRKVPTPDPNSPGI